MSSEPTYPDHFPPDCPPKPYTSPSGKYYRLVSRRPDPPPDDFLPGAELPGFVRSGGKGAWCRDCALSVFNSPEAARNFLVNIPIRQKVLAEMEVQPATGVMHPEPSGYVGQFNWWLPKGLLFRVFFRQCLNAV
jgi:hypothetical protein